MLKNHTDIEKAIYDYDYLGKQMKVLEEQREALKKQLVAAYFNDQPIYRDANGCVLATYQETMRSGLDKDKIEKELPEVYAQYLKVISYFQLRVK